jgi:hypothetical protein
MNRTSKIVLTTLVVGVLALLDHIIAVWIWMYAGDYGTQQTNYNTTRSFWNYDASFWSFVVTHALGLCYLIILPIALIASLLYLWPTSRDRDSVFGEMIRDEAYGKPWRSDPSRQIELQILAERSQGE